MSEIEKKDKILFLLPYFGDSFPSFFQHYLNSLSTCTIMDWLIVTDIDVSAYDIPENVTVIPKTFEVFTREVQETMRRELGIRVEINDPYKLCDYKPTYELLFKDYLEPYSHWAYGDCDMIWGDIDQFLGDFRDYDAVLGKGHLGVFKVNSSISGHWRELPHFIEDLAKPKHQCLDEGVSIPYLRTLIKSKIIRGRKIKLGKTVALVKPQVVEFRDFSKVIHKDVFVRGSVKKPLVKDQCFIREGKSLWFCQSGKKERELLYAHFYRRKFENNATGKDIKIIPNKIIDLKPSSSLDGAGVPVKHEFKKSMSDQRNIFIFWEGKSYKLLEKCKELLYAHHKAPRYKIHFVTYDNLAEYIQDVPPILWKLKQLLHVADFIRVNVISDFGGVWLDLDTVVLEELDCVFQYLEDGNDGFFITNKNGELCNSVFGSKPNTSVMKQWKEQVRSRLIATQGKIRWDELGSISLKWIRENSPECFEKYKIIDGPDTVFPLHWGNNVNKLLREPYENYKHHIRDFQPFLILTHKVYQEYEQLPKDHNFPLKYFIKKSEENIRKSLCSVEKIKSKQIASPTTDKNTFLDKRIRLNEQDDRNTTYLTHNRARQLMGKMSGQRNIFMFWEGRSYKLIEKLRDLIYKHHSDPRYVIHFITYKNLHKYIKNIPDFFKILRLDQQSDFVRANVICEHGGIWLDADTLVLEELDSLFQYLENGGDGFFVTIPKNRLINGIYGSVPNTRLMQKLRKDVEDILKDQQASIKRAEIGPHLLRDIYKEVPEYFQHYTILDGADSMCPTQFRDMSEQLLRQPYAKYREFVRNYQPCLVLVNQVYKDFETLKSPEKHPIQYFLNVSQNNIENQYRLSGTKRKKQDISKRDNKKTLKFIHITKTGGTAVENEALKKGVHWGKFDKDLKKKLLNGTLDRGPFWHQELQYFQKSYTDQFDFFTIVRNPYERVASEASWHFGKKANKELTHKKYNRFIQRAIKRKINEHNIRNSHFSRQVPYVFDQSGNQIIQHIVKYENLYEEFNALMREYGFSVELSENTKHNVSREVGFGVQDFSAESIELINQYYHDDFVKLGYAKINPNQESPTQQNFVKSPRERLPVKPGQDQGFKRGKPLKENAKKIFILWLQGWENAPQICKVCLESWKQHNPDWEICVLSEKNIEKFIPRKIYAEILKYETRTTQSDLIRLYLVGTYGGLYTDASNFCNTPLSDWLTQDALVDGIWMHWKQASKLPTFNFLYAEKENTRLLDIFHRILGQKRHTGGYLRIIRSFYNQLPPPLIQEIKEKQIGPPSAMKSGSGVKIIANSFEKMEAEVDADFRHAVQHYPFFKLTWKYPRNQFPLSEIFSPTSKLLYLVNHVSGSPEKLVAHQTQTQARDKKQDTKTYETIRRLKYKNGGLPPVVICGYPRGGTTLLLQVLIKTGIFDAGFGCGFLLASKPSKFKQMKAYRGPILNGWKVSEEDYKHICASKSHAQMYERLWETSGAVDRDRVLIDKTPDYLIDLRKVIERNPKAKYLVISRHPCSVIHSWTKNRRKKQQKTKNTSQMIRRYMKNYFEYQKVKQGPSGNQVFLVRYEELCLNPEKVCREICAFLGIEFEHSMTNFDEKKFNHVYQDSITTQYIDEYKQALPKKLQEEILLKTKEAKEFIVEAEERDALMLPKLNVMAPKHTLICMPGTGADAIRRNIKKQSLECMIADYKSPNVPIFYERGNHYTDTFLFTIIRNPWARLVEIFHYVCDEQNAHKFQIQSVKHYLGEFDGDFVKFVKALQQEPCLQQHFYFRPQTHWCNGPNKRNLDFIIQYETFERDLTALSHRINMPFEAKLPESTDYEFYYNDETKSIVEQLYREDIAYFGYSFESDAKNVVDHKVRGRKLAEVEHSSRRIYQIGFHKTATTSLHQFLYKNNIKSIHWDRGKLAQKMYENYASGKQLFEGYESYQAFSDMQFRFDNLKNGYAAEDLFKQMYQEDPEGLFILNIRPIEDWINSRINHAKTLEKDMRAYQKTRGEVLDMWREEYISHIKNVEHFFAGKENLLKFDISQHDGNYLAQFLNRFGFNCDPIHWQNVKQHKLNIGVQHQKKPSFKSAIAPLLKKENPSASIESPHHDLKQEHQYIFIGGLHRSGTTVLSKILRRQDNISGLVNTGVPANEGQHLIPHIIPSDRHAHRFQFLAYQPHMHLDETSALATAENKQEILKIWGKYWDTSKPYLLEKTPALNLFRMRFWQALFPNAYFIMIMRHPVAQSYAILDMLGQKPTFDNVEKQLYHWVKAYEIFESQKKYIRNLMLINYESFVENPQEYLDSIFDFIGNKEKPKIKVIIKNSTNDKYFKLWKLEAEQNTQAIESLMLDLEPKINRWGYSFDLSKPYMRDKTDTTVLSKVITKIQNYRNQSQSKLLFGDHASKKRKQKYNHKVVILGMAKSGTTALFSKIRASVPVRYNTFFEPSMRPTPEKKQEVLTKIQKKRRVLVKDLLFPQGDYNPYQSFDKKIVIIRDPRDIIVSSLLFRTGVGGFYKTDPEKKCREVLQILSQKRYTPEHYPITDVIDQFVRVFYHEKKVDDAEIKKHWLGLDRIDVLLKFMQDDNFFVFRYEDMIDEKFDALEQYLGFEIKAEAEVPDQLQRVVRTKNYGSWKHWLTQKDVEKLRPQFDPILKQLGYSTDWELQGVPQIPREHCEEYVLNLWRNWTFKEDGAMQQALKGIEKQSIQTSPRTALVACARNEGPYLLEWICYHKLLGFDDIYIYSHDNVDGSDALLQRLHDMNFIRYFDMTGKIPKHKKIQNFFYSEGYKEVSRTSAEWMCVIDLDEFIVLNQHKNIQEFVSSFSPKVEGVVLNWRMFCSSGQFEKKSGLVTERFTRLGSKNPILKKTIARMSALEKWNGSHFAGYKRGKSAHVVFPDGKPCLQSDIRNRQFHYTDEVAVINHYVVKSYEEFLVKVARGGGADRGKDVLNPKEDKTILFQRHNSKKLISNTEILEKPIYRKLESYLEKLIKEYELEDLIREIDVQFEQHAKTLLEGTDPDEIRQARALLQR